MSCCYHYYPRITIPGMMLANIQPSGTIAIDNPLAKLCPIQTTKKKLMLRKRNWKVAQSTPSRRLAQRAKPQKRSAIPSRNRPKQCYETSREHLTAAAKDVSEAAAAKYEELRGQAKSATEQYKSRAQSAFGDAGSKAPELSRRCRELHPRIPAESCRHRSWCRLRARESSVAKFAGMAETVLPPSAEAREPRMA